MMKSSPPYMDPITDNTNATRLRPVVAIDKDREFLEIPVNSFIKSYLPFDPSKEVIDRIVKHIVIPSSGTFTTTSNGSEKHTYSSLQTITDHISLIDNLVPGRERNQYHYREVTSSTMKSEIDGSTNSVDACFIREEKSATPSTHNIAVVIKYKHLEEHREQTNRRAALASVQIMNDDVRRIFTFAITVESEMVTVWYHSRSHSAVSEPFSLVKEPELLLKIFTSFLYANREELGYDPTVEHLLKEQYIFHGISNVKDRSVLDTYKTVGTISETRPNNVTGRMARVFKAVKLDPTTGKYGTKQYVLKDVWIDEASQTEKALQDEIFGDIERFWSTRKTPQALELIKERHSHLVSSKGYKKYFLSIESDYEGALTKPLPECFHSIRSQSVSCAELMDHTIPTSIADDQVPWIDFERTYTRKKQYRLVFGELCTTVGHLQTLGEVINVLFQTLIPLEMMLCAGWVHRDISSGNVLAYRKNLYDSKQPWRVVLADLEYAKKYPHLKELVGSADPKTGTPFFMPIEIMMQRSLFDHNQENVTKVARKLKAGKSQLQEASPVNLERSDSDSSNDYARFKQDTLSTPKNTSAVPWKGIVHNFQHDWESIWWIILWTITSRVVDVPEDAKSYAREIFQDSMEASSRRQKVFMESIRPDLEKHLGPLANYFAGPMDHIRKAMYKRYVLRELRGKLASVSSYTPVSVSFRSFFSDILEHTAKWSSTRLDITDHHIEPAERKRALPDDIDDEAEQHVNTKKFKAK